MRARYGDIAGRPVTTRHQGPISWRRNTDLGRASSCALELSRDVYERALRPIVVIPSITEPPATRDVSGLLDAKGVASSESRPGRVNPGFTAAHAEAESIGFEALHRGLCSPVLHLCSRRTDSAPVRTCRGFCFGELSPRYRHDARAIHDIAHRAARTL